MDPLSLVVTAFVAGASAAVTEAADQALKDALARLKSLLKKKVAGRPLVEEALNSYPQDRNAWRKLLKDELAQVGAGQDEKIVRAAQQVLALHDPEGAQTGKYNVTIAGGKAIAVIGDYATVFQIFTQAPPPLSSLIRVRQFKAYVDEKTRDFVGRDFVFAAIEKAIADDHFRSGYIVIQGEPGIGKTALLGELVRMPERYVHHFNVATLGIRGSEAFLSNVCAQLIVRYQLGHATLPPKATDDGGVLVDLLTEIANEPNNLPLVVVVDALDEAEDPAALFGTSQPNRLFLPPSLPAGVFFIVSTKQEHDYRLFVDSRRDIYLRDDDPQNLTDIRTYIESFVEANRGTMAPRIEQWGVPEDEFVDVLTEKSEGNFMYLVHVLRDIRSEELTAGTIDDIRKLPKGLRTYYQRHWNTMRSADPQRFGQYQKPVICLLATAREPVSRAQVVAWTRQFWANSGWNLALLDDTSIVEVVHDWEKFLNVDQTGDETRYRVYHASFQDFLNKEVGLTTSHITISDSALKKIPGFDASS